MKTLSFIPDKTHGIVLLCTILLSTMLVGSGLPDRLDRALLDSQYRFLSRHFPGKTNQKHQIVVIGIDDTSRGKISEPFPLWHRHIGRFLHAMAIARPKVVGMDILLPERSYDTLLPGYDLALRKGIIDARRQTRVIYARSILSDGSTRPILPRLLYSLGGHRNTGFVLWQLDSDRIVRRFSELFGNPPRHLPTLVGRMARHLGLHPASGYIDYRLGKPFAYFPFHKILTLYDNQQYDQLRNLFSNRIVFLGTVLSFKDRHYVPVNLAAWETRNANRIPGVLIHAQALRSIAAGRILKYPQPPFTWFLTIASVILWFACTRLLPGLMLYTTFLCISILASTISLTNGFILPVSSMLIAGILGLSSRIILDSSQRVVRAARNEADQRRIHEEITLAGEIQRGLLPPPASPGSAIAAVNIPAQTISGDFYDYLRLDKRYMVFNLGDVSGKGLKAALTMSNAHGLFHYLAQEIRRPSELLERINRELSARSTHGMFVTMTIGIYDGDTGQVCLANAGHMPSLVRSPDGKYREYPADGPPLGILADSRYRDTCFHLGEDRLYLYSDGISEILERFSSDDQAHTLRELIDRYRDLPVDEQVRAIVELVRDRREGLMDDVTLLALDPMAFGRQHT